MMASVFAAIAAMATVITLAMPLLARNDLSRRMNAVSVEREKLRQRERARRQGAAAYHAQAVHEARRRPVQPHQMGWPGAGAREASAGGLPRQRAVRDLPFLPHGRSDPRVLRVDLLSVLHSPDRQAGDG